MKPTHASSAYRLERILDLLLDKDLDQKELTEKLCMADPRQVGKYVDHLRGKNKVHIAGWRPPKPNGHRWPIYRFGKGSNKRKPKPKTNAEIMRAYWKRKGRGAANDPAPVASPFAVLFNLQEKRA